MFITLGKGTELSLSYTIPLTFYTKNKFRETYTHIRGGFEKGLSKFMSFIT